MRVRSARRPERGAVAIIVALTVVAVLIPTSALAVDLGNVYVRTASLQRAADEAARQGAVTLARQQNAGVPTAQAMDAARSAAVDLLCHDPSLNSDTDGDGVGDGPWHTLCAGGSAWASDGNPTNGEVQFYQGAPSAQHAYSAAQLAAGGASPVSGIRVLSPPSRVEYGLASAIPGQAPYADPQRSATATLRTVLPRFGFLPLFAMPDQVGGLCIRSAPMTIWNLTHPSGACDLPGLQVPRGYLNVPRMNSSETPTVVWNAARGFDVAHLPLLGQSIALAPQVTQSALVRDLSPGLFGNTSTFSGTGRLTSTGCPVGTQTVSGGHAGVEGAHLADLVDTHRVTADALRTAVLSGTAATPSQSGWLDPRILRCGRLALLPALNVPSSLPTNGLPGPAYRVIGWRLVWIDNEFRSGETSSQKIARDPDGASRCLQRGLYWADPNSYTASCKTDLRAITGYVLDPGFLPAVVSGQDAVNSVDYVASDLPATVRLIRDAADPPAG